MFEWGRLVMQVRTHVIYVRMYIEITANKVYRGSKHDRKSLVCPVGLTAQLSFDVYHTNMCTMKRHTRNICHTVVSHQKTLQLQLLF